MLLHDEGRKALGIDLKGSVVVIDEAHNLYETVNSIYSTELSWKKVRFGE